METAKTLIRSVARAFYPTELVLILDATLLHSALRDDDLALLMGLKVKDLRRLCSKLREDGLLAVHARSEVREGAQRPFLREYFWIDIHGAIDAIKWRLASVAKEVERQSGLTVDEKKEWFCQRCKSEWTQMEVLDSLSRTTGAFLCKKCGADLEFVQTSAATQAGHERQSRLNEQFKGLERLLRLIDDEDVPATDFNAALEAALPVIRDQSVNPAARTQPTERAHLPPASVKGMRNQPEKIEISLLGDVQEATEAEKAAEAERKRRLAEQNALPSWHTMSTITGEQTGLGVKQEAARREMSAATVSAAKVKAEDEEEKKANGLVDDSRLEAYFAALKEEQEQEALKQAEEEEEEDDDGSDEDDDDDDFEDVLDQSSKMPANGIAVGKSSANGDTPSAIGDDDSDRQPKRVKFDDPVSSASESKAPTPTAATAGDDKADEEAEDSEEEGEFEDAM